MTDACIFCEIVAGRAEASIAYEDEATLAFMDIGQLNPGHTLVVPKHHIADLFGLDAGVGRSLITALPTVARAVRDTFQPHGLSIWQSNGAPWQDVFHLHFHVLPRWRDDELLHFRPARSPLSRDELNGQAARIRAALDGPG